MSDMSIELMQVDGQRNEKSIERVRRSSVTAAAKYYEADAKHGAARLALAEARKRGAHPEEIYELMDAVSAAAKAKGKARYVKESAEFAFLEAVFPRP